MSLLEKAIGIAVEAHRGQRDMSGQPYVLHPLRVMFGCATAEEKIVGVLHDVVEDCEGWTFAKLCRCGFPKHILHALNCVTKRKGEDYDTFIARAASNAIARRVKLADLEDNLDVRRLTSVTAKDHRRLARYRRAYRWLSAQTPPPRDPS
jgi:(p)ppGpp synthase/HD superfamily hydrolase